MTQENRSTRLEVRRGAARPITLIFMGVCLLVAALFAAFAELPYAENALLMRIWMGYVGIPVSLAIIGTNLNKLLNRRNAILIDEYGITDTTTALSSGFTPWDDVSEIYVLHTRDDNYLCVEVHDLEAWLEKRSWWQRRLAQANLDVGISPIRIQFKQATTTITAKDAIKAVKAIKPSKIARARKQGI